MKELRLPLITKYFEMTDPKVKTEDYRDINEYWVKRFIDFSDYPKENKDDHKNFAENFVFDLNNGHSFEECLIGYYAKLKIFDFNTMTLGYPKKEDKTRIKKFEHKGIKIDYGKPEWGAEPNKIYFVIMHGNLINV